MTTKSKLAIELSKLKTFKNPNLKLEQYPTDSETAAEILWEAYLNNDIKNRTIADLGSGTGIISYGCLLLGAKKVYLVEKDKYSNSIAKENLRNFNNFQIIEKDISNFTKKVSTVIQNPPFGTRSRHADRNFLEKAIKLSDNIYSLHKTSTKDFISGIAQKHNFEVIGIMNFDHPIKKIYPHHKKTIQRIRVSCFILRNQSVL